MAGKPDSAEKQVEIMGGTTPEMVNGPQDCPTIYVDGLQGVIYSSHITKIMLVEHIPIDGKVLGRHVATLAIANDQAEKIIDALHGALAQMPRQKEEA